MKFLGAILVLILMSSCPTIEAGERQYFPWWGSILTNGRQENYRKKPALPRNEYPSFGPKEGKSRQFFPWGGSIPPFGTKAKEVQPTEKQFFPWGGSIPHFGQHGRTEAHDNPVYRVELDDSIVLGERESLTSMYLDQDAVMPRANYKCGVNNLGDEERIVGGQDATPHSFPWAVSLKVSWGTHFCGGSIINEKFILTAAHCVAWGKEILKAKIVVGAHNIEVSEGGHVSEHTVHRVKYHINYDRETTDSDVALIELREPIEFRANAIPVCLPDETETFQGQNATVIGWGRMAEYGDSSNTLQRVNVNIISNEVCKYMYEPIAVTNKMLCAGDPKGGRDACQGDSGGSLSLKGEEGEWKQVGIVSWGRGCGLPQYPGVYTRVTAFRDWINRHGKML